MIALLVLLALALAGCETRYDMPLNVYLAADVSEDERDTIFQALSTWNEALGVDVLILEDVPPPAHPRCGELVIRGVDHIPGGAAGQTFPVDAERGVRGTIHRCAVRVDFDRVYLAKFGNASAWATWEVLVHELGAHVLLHCMKDSEAHSHNPASLLNGESQLPGVQHLLPEDVARIAAHLGIAVHAPSIVEQS